MALTNNLWAFVFGILGNIISFVVFLAPVPTFVRICKKKSTEGFQSLPYVSALFSAMLWIYYAMQKDGTAFLLITINAFGCVIETIYIVLFVSYANKKTRISTLKVLGLLNFLGFAAIVLVCELLTKGSTREKVLGGICVGFSVSVFAAPLSIMRVVVRTRSVEFMPFSLSLFLTISAVTWLFYGLAIKDFYVALPNVLGAFLGAVQMILYIIFKYYKTPVAQKTDKSKDVSDHSIDIAKLTTVIPGAVLDSAVHQPPALHNVPETKIQLTEVKSQNMTDPKDQINKDVQKQSQV
ncbi:Bidirectional sugar transporter SWEET13 [Arabidopsis thaliana]|jgi:solute carrier family 50 protein (sugar transporter)|uniref:Bidirectional sugar transporter SWEET13 n=5 Tax=Arabidopsis TaxID=3701 RepID=SWT13_ARATH|nr:Nodulin MtN3 family protein [Arabidopsis thaliana]Q9FGQ2.1 RecName: Full=Bidirectional sugar transporter SWEET13; Short=AtSWEET13; AltName: Full=Protein SUGARS WILL EVENTUALLY BE EXPORTED TRANSPORTERS 13 [Arabidopsis thaliana]KAG7605625.1 SWEET sugar transporter [Arabidopsis thaliana x Arabidopsis arenosa]KAG7612550.1 SWEET sugar transporter [Arabidopsis suecica]AED95993.1 Nodulin MtN3 family protein [Arabidopsis thaliana]OAO94326.1 SWEET13 [Arabidopsis thaliana]CAA0408954.1 unnamed protei|eukprot:NP_199893.1 Nodulin MtN3 family protein [Arabidopsis thaliana]